MKIPSTQSSSQLQHYAEYRAAMEAAAQARERRAAENAAPASRVGSRLSLKVASVAEEPREVSGLVVHEAQETPVSPGSVAVLDTASGKLIYRAPPPQGLV